MGTVSLWTYSVILLCFGRITFSHRCSYENPSREYRNVPSKLNLRNFLGSKLVQRLADNYGNRPQYEPYEHQCSNTFSYDQQMAHPPQPLHQPSLPQSLPPPPQPPSFLRGIPSYEYQNQRVPVQTLTPPSLPQGIGISQGFGAPGNELTLPPSHAMGPLPSHVIGSPPPHTLGPPPPHTIGPPPPHTIGPPPPHTIGSPPPHTIGPPPPHTLGPPPCHAMELSSRGMSSSPQQMGPSNTHENYYTETVTSSCPGSSCESCPECETADQDYSFQDEPCSCCSEGNCPCACEECPCCCRGKGCCCGGRCLGYSGGDTSYPSEKEYSEREQNYDEYPASDCPCECSGNHECSCAYSEEPQSPSHHIRERPNYRRYSSVNAMNENYMEGPSDAHIQHHSDRYVGVVGPPGYKSISSTKEFQPSSYSQYEEPIESPSYVKLPSRRTFVSQPVPQSDLPQPINHHAPASELPEEPMHHHHHIAETHERVIQHPHLSEVPERTMHHTEITEQTVHRYHEPISPVQMQPVEPYPIHQEMPRVNEWRPMPRMPPSGPPRHMMEDESSHPEPLPIYRKYQPLTNRYGRKHRQPLKPPFFDGLNYSDGC